MRGGWSPAIFDVPAGRCDHLRSIEANIGCSARPMSKPPVSLADLEDLGQGLARVAQRMRRR